MSIVGMVTGMSRPRWHVQQVTTWRFPKLVRLIAATISVIRRAMRFLSVSASHLTASVPASI